jgi:hypothetical protein
MTSCSLGQLVGFCYCNEYQRRGKLHLTMISKVQLFNDELNDVFEDKNQKKETELIGLFT